MMTVVVMMIMVVVVRATGIVHLVHAAAASFMMRAAAPAPTVREGLIHASKQKHNSTQHIALMRAADDAEQE